MSNVISIKEGKRSLKTCEFCAKKFVSKEDTVCGPCDNKLEKQQGAQILKLETAHAKKFKCKQCGDGLPLSRARHCFTCVPSEASRASGGMPAETINEDFMLCG